MPVIAVIGSIVADILVQTPHLPASGENMHVARIEVSTGGKAANAAVAFVRLGGRAHLFGQVGDDAFGRMAQDALRAEGVNIAGIEVDARTPTGAGVLLVEPNGETAFIIAAGANLTLAPESFEQRFRPLLPELDGLLFNFEAPEPVLLLAERLAYERGVPVFVDAGPNRPYSPQLWRRAAVLTPNRPEAESMVGHPIRNDAEALAAARTLLAQGPQAVVLKLDARGALLVTPEQSHFIPAHRIQPVDSAGAGDAFTAGLVLALLQGASLLEAASFANACGALAASRFGAMPSMPRLEEVMRKMTVSERVE
ncbi:MAG: ribokinase [Chloroflexi bacterium]|nr:ribokinase [Chloroflexota bacterium]